MARILWIILGIVVVFWLIGFIAGFAGNLIHILLVVALVVLVINLITGRKGVCPPPDSTKARPVSGRAFVLFNVLQ